MYRFTAQGRIGRIDELKKGGLRISVAADQPWISLNGVSGPLNLNLNGVGDSTIVTVGYGPAANALAAGLYNGTVSFTNLSGGTGSTPTGAPAPAVARPRIAPCGRSAISASPTAPAGPQPVQWLRERG